MKVVCKVECVDWLYVYMRLSYYYIKWKWCVEYSGLMLAIGATTYYKWKERNSRLFKRGSRALDEATD